MNGYCEVCDVATSQGVSGTIYYCGHKQQAQAERLQKEMQKSGERTVSPKASSVAPQIHSDEDKLRKQGYDAGYAQGRVDEQAKQGAEPNRDTASDSPSESTDMRTDDPANRKPIHSDETREKVIVIVANSIFAGKSLDQIIKISKKELVKMEGMIDDIMELLANTRREAYTEVLEAMPEKFRNSAMTTTETNHYGAGFNHCHDTITKTIQTLREGMEK